ncbi:D-2-hydroxyacid dehydrogenase [Alkalihalobacterium elongatum]|uniref:D-2-hydroxyacid dehydrogenase n=1 Tax=Alkalihalobacterium elongatum TaxID=2675466 RepID=UPI001C1F406B|nr:D-2-hydroxyacid dehydrogenase [Alkalihalobacterium elongatum]
MKVVSSAKVKPDIQQRLKEEFPSVTFHFYSNIDEVGKDLEDTEILITYGEDLQETHIKQAQKLKWIMVISAGVEELPFRAIKSKGILVSNAKGIHKKPMAEYTLGMILQVARKTKELLHQQENKDWNRRLPMTEINTQTIGVIGVGAIGSEIARLAKAFGMKTLGINRSGKKVEYIDQMFTMESLGDMLKLSDYVVSVLPSTEETKLMINDQFFKVMKPSGVFINIGRGQTVVEDDLIKALNEKVIAHAVLDVFQQEPLPKDHPFWSMDNVTITPHISGVSPQYQYRAFEIFKENLGLYSQGKNDLVNLIDVNIGY